MTGSSVLISPATSAHDGNCCVTSFLSWQRLRSSLRNGDDRHRTAAPRNQSLRRGSVADDVPPRTLEGTKRGYACRGHTLRHANILLAGARRLGHLRIRCLKSCAAKVRLGADGEGGSSRFASRRLLLL